MFPYTLGSTFGSTLHSLSSTFPLSMLSGVVLHVLRVLYLRQYLKLQLKLLILFQALNFQCAKGPLNLKLFFFVCLFDCLTCPVNSSFT